MIGWIILAAVLVWVAILLIRAAACKPVEPDYGPDIAVDVDGEAVDETAFGLSNNITTSPYSSFEPLVFPQTVPEGCVFVLGDNRSVSKDSRYAEVGMIDERHILGEAVFRLYPFNRFGQL